MEVEATEVEAVVATEVEAMVATVAEVESVEAESAEICSAGKYIRMSEDVVAPSSSPELKSTYRKKCC